MKFWRKLFEVSSFEKSFMIRWRDVIFPKNLSDIDTEENSAEQWDKYSECNANRLAIILHLVYPNIGSSKSLSHCSIFITFIQFIILFLHKEDRGAEPTETSIGKRFGGHSPPNFCYKCSGAVAITAKSPKMIRYIVEPFGFQQHTGASAFPNRTPSPT